MPAVGQVSLGGAAALLSSHCSLSARHDKLCARPRDSQVTYSRGPVEPQYRESAVHSATERSSSLEELLSQEPAGDEVGTVDVLVAGAGPSGLSLAAAASKIGMSVVLVDPGLTLEWPNNYGVWVDEFQALGLEDCLAKIWPRARVTFEEEGADRLLERPYGQVDRNKLKSLLLRICVENHVRFVHGKVHGVQHAQEKSVAQCTNNLRIEATMVVDATGFSRKLLQFESPSEALDDGFVSPGYQVTYGILAEVESHPYCSSEEMVLMDWRSGHLADEQRKANEREPSFLYVMPFSKSLVFLEETSLVDRPEVCSDELKKRLMQRLQFLDIKVNRIIDEERARIPMGGVLPVIPQLVLGIGGSAGMVHPSTGYMIARALEKSVSIAKELKELLETRVRGACCTLYFVDIKDFNLLCLDRPTICKLSLMFCVKSVGMFSTRLVYFYVCQELSRTDRNNGIEFYEGCWAAIWSEDEQRQWEFMNLGMQILCELEPMGLRSFFRAFFALEGYLWGGYLSWRLSGSQCILMGLSLLSVAPPSFRLKLVWTTLPFLPYFASAWIVSCMKSLEPLNGLQLMTPYRLEEGLQNPTDLDG